MGLDAKIAKRLAEFQPNDIQWTISVAYATRRADSIHAAKNVLLNAEPKFQKESNIKYNLACHYCQLGEIETAKNYLKKAFEIDLSWRMAALEDEDLKSLSGSL
jgi:Tfp pilus assembly protein PilF